MLAGAGITRRRLGSGDGSAISAQQVYMSNIYLTCGAEEYHRWRMITWPAVSLAPLSSHLSEPSGLCLIQASNCCVAPIHIKLGRAVWRSVHWRSSPAIWPPTQKVCKLTPTVSHVFFLLSWICSSYVHTYAKFTFMMPDCLEGFIAHAYSQALTQQTWLLVVPDCDVTFTQTARAARRKQLVAAVVQLVCEDSTENGGVCQTLPRPAAGMGACAVPHHATQYAGVSGVIVYYQCYPRGRAWLSMCKK
jgi:hypothetical protein